jgi:hypothetical protein
MRRLAVVAQTSPAVDREDPDGHLSVIRTPHSDIAIAPSLLATSDRSNERIGAVHWSGIDAA